MTQTILNRRRKQLGITISALARMSGVPVATVNRILAEPGKVRFEHVAAVGRVLGVDFATAKKVPVAKVLHNRALEKRSMSRRLFRERRDWKPPGSIPPGFSGS